jgi:eukaryotic-like serine/threonine-protein kinase
MEFMDTDRNLLFGVLALQMELIDPMQFADACAGWAAQKNRPLAELLVERGWITPTDRQDVERLLERKLHKHGGNAPETIPDVAGPAAGEAAQGEAGPSPGGLAHASTVMTTEGEPSETRARYSLCGVHAEGGLGRIYVAHDPDLNRDVALKEIKPQQAGVREAYRRFLREAQVTGQLEHPNIVPVYELARRPEDGTPFYTMRLVQGETLRDAITRYHHRRKQGKADRLELPRLLQAFVSICHAIGYAHSRGVVHRDLKPENVILGEFGEVIVLDWGLAKVLGQAEEDSDLTQVSVTGPAQTEATAAGRLLGTPAYMAPEQAEGRPDLVGPRTDVYGLGALLFRILTNAPPHHAESWMEAICHVTELPTPHARAVEPSVSPALDAVCARAMARAPEDRYARAADLADDVERYLADEPVSVYRDPLLRRISRWARRNRVWASAAVLSVLGILFTTVLASVLLARMAEQEYRARKATETMREQGIRATATFAARTVASEVDLRWRILETEAADPELRRLLPLLRSGGKLKEDPAWPPLQAWLEGRRVKHAQTARATSWFLTDRSGTQVARSPASETIGENYAYRDYFNGRGIRLTPEEAVGIEPIKDVHRSYVFKSRATGTLMVAFSVPVWSDEPGPAGRHVIGVLGMTLESGRFSVLSTDLGEDQVVLVDTRQDWIEGEGKSGLIFHHPRWTELQANRTPGVPVQIPIIRLDPGRAEQLIQFRALRMRQDEELEKLNWDQQLTFRREPTPDNFDRDYRDPVGGAYAGTWLAAFEPVLIKGRPDRIKDTGWVVIVQQRPGATP